MTPVVPRPMTEREWQDFIIELATWQGWLVYHTHDSRRSAAGFPDLVLVHPQKRRVIFAELKDAKRALTDDQNKWMQALTLVAEQATNVEAYVWRPHHVDDVKAILSSKGKPFVSRVDG